MVVLLLPKKLSRIEKGKENRAAWLFVLPQLSLENYDDNGDNFLGQAQVILYTLS